MGAAYTVALVGFSQAESATFESFFRLAARRPPAYLVQEEVLDAQVLIVNADNAQALMLVRGARLPGRASTARPWAAGCLPAGGPFPASSGRYAGGWKLRRRPAQQAW